MAEPDNTPSTDTTTPSPLQSWWNGVSASVRGSWSAATQSVGNWVSENTGGRVRSDQAQAAIPIIGAATAVGAGLLLSAFGPLGTVGRGIGRFARNLVTGFGYFERIPVIGSVFTGLGAGLTVIGEGIAYVGTGIAGVLAYQALQTPPEPVPSPHGEDLNPQPGIARNTPPISIGSMPPRVPADPSRINDGEASRNRLTEEARLAEEHRRIAEEQRRLTEEQRPRNEPRDRANDPARRPATEAQRNALRRLIGENNMNRLERFLRESGHQLTQGYAERLNNFFRNNITQPSGLAGRIFRPVLHRVPILGRFIDNSTTGDSAADIRRVFNDGLEALRDGISEARASQPVEVAPEPVRAPEIAPVPEVVRAPEAAPAPERAPEAAPAPERIETAPAPERAPEGIRVEMGEAGGLQTFRANREGTNPVERAAIGRATSNATARNGRPTEFSAETLNAVTKTIEHLNRPNGGMDNVIANELTPERIGNLLEAYETATPEVRADITMLTRTARGQHRAGLLDFVDGRLNEMARLDPSLTPERRAELRNRARQTLEYMHGEQAGSTPTPEHALAGEAITGEQLTNAVIEHHVNGGEMSARITDASRTRTTTVHRVNGRGPSVTATSTPLEVAPRPVEVAPVPAPAVEIAPVPALAEAAPGGRPAGEMAPAPRPTRVRAEPIPTPHETAAIPTERPAGWRAPERVAGAVFDILIIQHCVEEWMTARRPITAGQTIETRADGTKIIITQNGASDNNGLIDFSRRVTLQHVRQNASGQWEPVSDSPVMETYFLDPENRGHQFFHTAQATGAAISTGGRLVEAAQREIARRGGVAFNPQTARATGLQRQGGRLLMYAYLAEQVLDAGQHATNEQYARAGATLGGAGANVAVWSIPGVGFLAGTAPSRWAQEQEAARREGRDIDMQAIMLETLPGMVAAPGVEANRIVNNLVRGLPASTQFTLPPAADGTTQYITIEELHEHFPQMHNALLTLPYRSRPGENPPTEEQVEQRRASMIAEPLVLWRAILENNGIRIEGSTPAEQQQFVARQLTRYSEMTQRDLYNNASALGAGLMSSGLHVPFTDIYTGSGNTAFLERTSRDGWLAAAASEIKRYASTRFTSIENPYANTGRVGQAPETATIGTATIPAAPATVTPPAPVRPPEVSESLGENAENIRRLLQAGSSYTSTAAYTAWMGYDTQRAENSRTFLLAVRRAFGNPTEENPVTPAVTATTQARTNLETALGNAGLTPAQISNLVPATPQHRVTIFPGTEGMYSDGNNIPPAIDAFARSFERFYGVGKFPVQRPGPNGQPVQAGVAWADMSDSEKRVVARQMYNYIEERMAIYTHPDRHYPSNEDGPAHLDLREHPGFINGFFNHQPGRVDIGRGRVITFDQEHTFIRDVLAEDVRRAYENSNGHIAALHPATDYWGDTRAMVAHQGRTELRRMLGRSLDGLDAEFNHYVGELNRSQQNGQIAAYTRNARFMEASLALAPQGMLLIAGDRIGNGTDTSGGTTPASGNWIAFRDVRTSRNYYARGTWNDSGVFNVTSISSADGTNVYQTQFEMNLRDPARFVANRSLVTAIDEIARNDNAQVAQFNTPAGAGTGAGLTVVSSNRTLPDPNAPAAPARSGEWMRIHDNNSNMDYYLRGQWQRTLRDGQLISDRFVVSDVQTVNGAQVVSAEAMSALSESQRSITYTGTGQANMSAILETIRRGSFEVSRQEAFLGQLRGVYASVTQGSDAQGTYIELVRRPRNNAPPGETGERLRVYGDFGDTAFTAHHIEIQGANGQWQALTTAGDNQLRAEGFNGSRLADRPAMLMNPQLGTYGWAHNGRCEMTYGEGEFSHMVDRCLREHASAANYTAARNQNTQAANERFNRFDGQIRPDGVRQSTSPAVYRANGVTQIAVDYTLEGTGATGRRPTSTFRIIRELPAGMDPALIRTLESRENGQPLLAEHAELLAAVNRLPVTQIMHVESGRRIDMQSGEVVDGQGNLVQGANYSFAALRDRFRDDNSVDAPAFRLAAGSNGSDVPFLMNFTDATRANSITADGLIRLVTGAGFDPQMREPEAQVQRPASGGSGVASTGTATGGGAAGGNGGSAAGGAGNGNHNPVEQTHVLLGAENIPNGRIEGAAALLYLTPISGNGDATVISIQKGERNGDQLRITDVIINGNRHIVPEGTTLSINLNNPNDPQSAGAASTLMQYFNANVPALQETQNPGAGPAVPPAGMTTSFNTPNISEQVQAQARNVMNGLAASMLDQITWAFTDNATRPNTPAQARQNGNVSGAQSTSTT